MAVKKITPKPTAKTYTLKKSEPKIITTTKTTKPVPKATPKKSQPNNTLINRIREDWSQPKPTWIDGKGLRDAASDRYPYGSLTGRKRNGS